MTGSLRGTRKMMRWGINDAQDSLRSALKRLRFTVAMHGSTRSVRAMIHEVEGCLESGEAVLKRLRDVEFDDCDDRALFVGRNARLKSNPPHLRGG